MGSEAKLSNVYRDLGLSQCVPGANGSESGNGSCSRGRMYAELAPGLMRLVELQYVKDTVAQLVE